MKLLTRISVLAVTAVLALAQSAPTTLVPSSTDITLEWDHVRGDATEFYKLYRNNVLFRTFPTNGFTVQFTSTNVVLTNIVVFDDTLLTNVTLTNVLVTNVTFTCRSILTNGLPKGTNNLTLTAANGVDEGPPSSNIIVRALGKPVAPQGLRKP